MVLDVRPLISSAKILLLASGCFSWIYLVDRQEGEQSMERVYVGDAFHGMWHVDDPVQP